MSVVDDAIDEVTREWGPRRQQEALRRTYELAAELSETLDVERLDALTHNVWAACETERIWRAHLMLTTRLDSVRLDREVRLVRAPPEAT